MAERKDHLHWLDGEEQAVEALLSNVHPVQLRRPLRPFVVLTLDTMDFACWLFGVDAADPKLPASLTRGAGEEEVVHPAERLVLAGRVRLRSPDNLWDLALGRCSHGCNGRDLTGASIDGSLDSGLDAERACRE